MNTIGIYLGRFAPVTKAHKFIIDTMSMYHKKSYLCCVKGKKSSKIENPFDFKLQYTLLKQVLPYNVNIVKVKTGFIPDIIYNLPGRCFTIYCGSDRYDGYSAQLKYALDDGKIFKVVKIEYDSKCRATFVREALKNKNENVFRRLVPVELWNDFDVLCDVINNYDKPLLECVN